MSKKMLFFTIFLLAALPVSLFAVKEVTLNIPTPNYDIPAILATPDEDGTYPGIVMVHGFGSEKNEVGNFYKRLAGKLADNGIASIRFDFPGSGDHALGFEATDINRMINDTFTVLNWFETQEIIDANKIGLLGFSLGGVVGSYVAGNDSRIKALGLWSTPGNLAVSQADLYQSVYPETLNNEYVEVDLGWRKINLTKEYFESIYSVFPLFEITKYYNPLLVVAGEIDELQPEYARQFAVRAGSFDVKLEIIPEGDHIYQVLTPDQTMAEGVIDLTNDWFIEKLYPPKQSEPFTFTVDKLEVQNENRAIPLVVTIPERDGDVPLALLLHGFGGSKDEGKGFVQLSEELAKSGIASLRMDFAGCGESKASFREYSLKSNMSDTKACLNYALENYNIDLDKIGLFGYSMGGAVSVLLTAELDHPYRSMILLAPGVEASEDSIQNTKNAIKEASKNGYVSMNWFGSVLEVDLDFYQGLLDAYDVFKTYDNTCETIVIFGDKDTIVLPEHSLAFASQMGVPAIMLPEADHGYGFYSDQPDVTEILTEITIGFYMKTF